MKFLKMKWYIVHTATSDGQKTFYGPMPKRVADLKIRNDSFARRLRWDGHLTVERHDKRILKVLKTPIMSRRTWDDANDLYTSWS